jgi:hypothetical protein
MLDLAINIVATAVAYFVVGVVALAILAAIVGFLLLCIAAKRHDSTHITVETPQNWNEVQYRHEVQQRLTDIDRKLGGFPSGPSSWR